MQTEAEMTHQRPGFQCCLPVRNLSCENELEELMHQIDVMVNSKKVEWERQIIGLQQRVESQAGELAEARNVLDQKTCEIGILCKQLEQSENAQCEKVQNYERQLQALNHQLCKLKKSYEKINFYNSKNPSQRNVEPYTADNTCQTELRWLTQKLEEFKVRSKEWEKQSMMYQNHLKSLSEQKKSLTDKCELFQKQSQSYQEQLSSRTRLHEEAITNNQTEIRRLRCQLDASQETIGSDGVIIENLKSTVKEITLSRNSLKDENQRLLQELKKCQKQCQSMENELSEAKLGLQARDDLLRAADLDQRQIQKTIPDTKPGKNLQGNNPSLQEQNGQWPCKTQNQEQAKKRFRLCKFNQNQIENDLQKEEAKNNDLERLRTDITDLTAKLNQKEVTMATMREKLSGLERALELREQDNVNLQALKWIQGEHDHTDHYTGKLPAESERSQDHHIKPSHEMKEQLPVKMKVTPGHNLKSGTQTNGHLDRSYMEKSNRNTLNQSANHTDNNQALQSDSDVDLCDGDWDSPSQSLMINLDSLHTFSAVIPNGSGHLQNVNLDFPDLSHIFVCGQQNGTTMPSSTGISFISAAEKFLHEENQRAEDFEKILNSHIEEMQRYSENTLAKYTILNQNRHI
ncbi:deuterosome assembly protein 1 [Pelodytes ibericus]